jgi:hypothetical protein
MGSAGSRLRDFEQRARFAPDDVQNLPGLGCYITVHPMADESDLLRKLGIDRSACREVDLYWATGDDVSFVQVMVEGLAVQRKAGYYVRRNFRGHVNMVAVVTEDVVDSGVVERALRHFARYPVSRRKLRQALQPLADLVRPQR